VNNTRPNNTLIASLLLVSLGLAGCSSDIKSTDPVGTTTNGQNAETDTGSTAGNGTSGNNPDTTGAASNGLYTLNLSNDNVLLVEGGSVTVNLQINRSAGHNRLINLAVDGQTDADDAGLWWEFSDEQITGTENSSQITFNMNIGAMPIQRQFRTLRILGTDGNSQTISSVLELEIEPTGRADVYLLVGQSNMVGISEPMAKRSAPGQADAPNPRIKQLNVTGNGVENFPTEASFSNINTIAVPGQRLTTAIDPLHDGYDSTINGKEGTNIGLGMSFAKRAILDTQTTIYLVPAAWSNTGFCKRSRPDYQGDLGWNASATDNPALSGTLLHDRAIARANLALAETGGILRGILWHQGEADSDDMACATTYEQNLKALVASLRTNINQDARGPIARGPNSDVPFVLGTMSQGGSYVDQPEPKQIVDGVHRNIKSIVPYSAIVYNDDLVPPAYACGSADGDCIHFGSAAYREMGSRYYDFILQANQP